MTHDRAWHERRRLSGGASDLPVILGISPYANASPLVLAWEKRGELPISDDPLTMDRWVSGEYEAMGRRWLARELGCEVTYEPERDDFVSWCCSCSKGCNHLTELGWPCCIPCNDMPGGRSVHAHANLDGRVVYEDRELVYEGKVITHGNPEYDAWKRNGVPESIAWQVQQQLLCSQLPAGLIVVHDAGRAEFGVRVIEADAERQAFIEDVWRKWWTAAVVEKRDPATQWTDGVARAIKRRWPGVDASKTIQLTDEDLLTVRGWHEAKNRTRETKKLADAANIKLKKRMEDSPLGKLPDGSTLTRSVASNGSIRLRWKQLT